MSNEKEVSRALFEKRFAFRLKEVYWNGERYVALEEKEAARAWLIQQSWVIWNSCFGLQSLYDGKKNQFLVEEVMNNYTKYNDLEKKSAVLLIGILYVLEQFKVEGVLPAKKEKTDKLINYLPLDTVFDLAKKDISSVNPIKEYVDAMLKMDCVDKDLSVFTAKNYEYHGAVAMGATYIINEALLAIPSVL